MRLSLPPPPEPPAPTPFPVLGVIAPLLAALLIWAVTRSPFALVFAALSPIVAIASVLDSRLQGRRRRARAAAEEAVQLAELGERVERTHDADRAAWFAATPTGRSIADGTAPQALLWRGSAEGERQVVLGCGAVPSGIAIDGVAASPPARLLVEHASVVQNAPVLAEVRNGIGICGVSALTTPALRGLVLQLVFALAPASAGIRGRPEGGEWSWLELLPHWETGSLPSPCINGVDQLTIRLGTADVVLAAAPSASDLPPACRTVFAITGAHEVLILAGASNGEPGGSVSPEFVTRADAVATARSLRARAARLPDDHEAELLPDRVSLTELLAQAGPDAPERPGGCAAVVALSARGSEILDLVTDGPHAVVGGTTGSGKSELLITWVASLASSRTPGELTFLLVDFKGGAAFDALARLPHCVGLITDLDPLQAARALESLRAELRFRERSLRERGLRDIAQIGAVGGLPRLVIVVDEFAAMLVDFPELHDVFVDIASRGRSLGVHLILCTQRPAGAVRDSLLANCNLRLSLRVNGRADSTAVIGTDAAAKLAPRPVGRCLVSAGGGDPVLTQIATLSPDELDGLVRRCAAQASDSGEPPPRRPWLDPLPALLRLVDLEDPGVDSAGVTGGIAFGLIDVPSEQLRRYASWHPAEDGHLLVLGAHRSGKSACVETIATVGAETIPFVVAPRDPSGAWDAVHDALDSIRSARALPARRVLVLDDVDAVFARYDADYQPEFLDTLLAVMREGPARGLRVLLTAQRLAGALFPLATFTGQTLLLRMANRQEHALAGGEASRYDDALPPGAGWWRGHRLQTAFVFPRAPVIPAASAPPPPLTLRFGHGYAVVSTRPGAIVERLIAGGRGMPVAVTDLSGRVLSSGGPAGVSDAALPPIDVLLGDPDEWQAQWNLLTAARPNRVFVYDGCGVRDYRAISRSRTLPPPIAGDGRTVWFVKPGGEAERRVLAR